jgi:hypothetical protein
MWAEESRLLRPTKLALVRLWLFEHDEGVNLVGVLSVTGVLAVAVVAFVHYPLGPSQRTTATIASLGMRVGRTSTQTANVVMEDRSVSVALPRTNSCTVRGRIHLVTQRRLWGLSVTADWPPCDPSLER